MSQIIKFEPNVAVLVQLRYADGKETQGDFGPQVMFSTHDDRRIFATPVLAAKIRETGVLPGEPIEICKRTDGRSTRWEVTRVGDPPRETAPVPAVARPAAAAPASPATAVAQQQPRLSPMALAVAGAFGAAFDGLTEARGYMARHGFSVQFSPEDLRATALTVLIQSWRSGAGLAPTPQLNSSQQQPNGGNQSWRQ